MEKSKLSVGDVVQLSGDCDMFAYCLMVVTELKSFGAVGYVQIPNRGQAYYRVAWDKMEFVGEAKWIAD